MAITRMQKLMQENKQLKEKLSIAQADEEEEANLSCKLLEENNQLKSDLVYAESEVARYSNALELEYVPKWEHEELQQKYLQVFKDRLKAFPVAPSDLPEKLGKIIEKLKEELEKTRETAIHYWSGGDYGECYAQEVIPQNIRAAVEDQ